MSLSFLMGYSRLFGNLALSIDYIVVGLFFLIVMVRRVAARYKTGIVS